LAPEQVLIEQLKQGDEAAFRQIVEQWQDMVYNTVLGIVQNETEAEDVTQDVFIKVYESIGSFKGESKFSTWLYRIAVTRSLELLRSKKRKKRFAFLQPLFGAGQEEKIQPADFHHPGVSLDNKERAAQLFKAIDKLPENQKAAFVLHKLEGLSYKEISETLQTTVPAVESLMNRAKNNLKKYLESYYQNTR
jgi:RNA polymerase sigma-70 factor (ECF subfamily)